MLANHFFRRLVEYSAPSITDDPVRTGQLSWIFFGSFLFWVIYTGIMFYLYYEHKVRKQYPQHLIMLLFSLGCLCRCVWFGLFSDYGETIYLQLLNRIAMLLQFSAISLLLLMWSRALKVSSKMDEITKKRTDYLQSRSNPGTTPPPMRQFTDNSAVDVECGTSAGRNTEMARTSINSSNSIVSKVGTTEERTISNTSSTIGSRTVGSSISQPTLFTTGGRTVSSISSEHRHNLFWLRILWISVNIIAYGVILGTVIFDSDDTVWEVNLIALSVLCLVVMIGIIFVGLMNWVRLREELSVVYTTDTNQKANTATNADESSNGKFFERFQFGTRSTTGVTSAPTQNSFSCSCYTILVNRWENLYYNHLIPMYRFISGVIGSDSNRLKIQTEVLRTVLFVSTVVAIFFFARAYAFMYAPVILGNPDDTSKSLFGRYSYPWLFYQFPELFPNLVIAMGISPPKGILRQLKTSIIKGMVWLYKSFRTCIYVTCCTCGASDESNVVRNKRSESYDDEGRTDSVHVPNPINKAPTSVKIGRLSTDTDGFDRVTFSVSKSDIAQRATEQQILQQQSRKAINQSSDSNTSATTAVTTSSTNPMWSATTSADSGANGTAPVAATTEKQSFVSLVRAWFTPPSDRRATQSRLNSEVQRDLEEFIYKLNGFESDLHRSSALAALVDRPPATSPNPVQSDETVEATEITNIGRGTSPVIDSSTRGTGWTNNMDAFY